MRQLLTLAIALLFSLSLTARAGTFSDDQKKEMEDIIHSYLLEHPEVLNDMVDKLKVKEEKDAAASLSDTLATSSKNIFHNGVDGVIGNSHGDVTIVEFMDYNCGWCRKSIKNVQELVKKDKNIRVVMKEWPIFGEGSEAGARAAMAAAKQGKYWELHQALFAFQGQVTPEVVMQTAKATGLDMKKLKDDMMSADVQANLDATIKLATDLKFTGTPGFLVNKNVFPGYMELARMESTVADERAKGVCKDC
ncbi:MAG: DsbA family protein [Aestuariivirga sp.]